MFTPSVATVCFANYENKYWFDACDVQEDVRKIRSPKRTFCHFSCNIDVFYCASSTPQTRTQHPHWFLCCCCCCRNKNGICRTIVFTAALVAFSENAVAIHALDIIRMQTHHRTLIHCSNSVRHSGDDSLYDALSNANVWIVFFIFL